MEALHKEVKLQTLTRAAREVLALPFDLLGGDYHNNALKSGSVGQSMSAKLQGESSTEKMTVNSGPW